MQKVTSFFVLFLFGSIYASSEVSLDLTAYVDPEVNIERIDSNGTLDIFQRIPACYRVTSNTEKNVKVSFSSRNGWKLKNENGNSSFISYVGEFSGRDRNVTVGEGNDSVLIEKDSFCDSEYDFKVVFISTGSMKNFAAGKYYDRVTISVSTEE
ncbi:MAG: hypothetical protein J6T91_01620 [Alphaproteobacteria bacterium]|nr:hypothetical protein [Alphaproteobacteria bacterium]